MKRHKQITIGRMTSTPPARQVREPQRVHPHTEPDEDRPYRLPKRKKPEGFEIVMNK